MASSQNPTTATIYQFPTGGRSGLIARRQAEPRLQGEPITQRPPRIMAGAGAWYHEAAIEESERALRR